MRGVVLSLLLFTVTAVAAPPVPPLITYQGRLLDSTGAPVADGNYHITFRLYDSPTDGTLLWESGSQSVPVTDGLFTYTLGSAVPLPDGLFAENLTWLGITVPPDPEMVPRVQLTSDAYTRSAAYSHSAGSAQSAQNANRLGNQLPSYYLDWNNLANVPAGFADGIDNTGINKTLSDSLYLNIEGDTISDDIVMYQTDGDTGLVMRPKNGYLGLYGIKGERHVSLSGGLWGNVDLYDASTPPKRTVHLAAEGAGGKLTLYDGAGTPQITLSGGAGDGAVEVPDGAINNNEILNEVGIAYSNNISGISGGRMDSITINAPTSGYVVVLLTGYYSLGISGDINTYADAEISISDTTVFDNSCVTRVEGHGTLYGWYTWPVAISRTEYVTGGTKKYYAIAFTHAEASFARVHMTGFFVPSAYGPVETLPPPTAPPPSPSMSRPAIPSDTSTGFQRSPAMLQTEQSRIRMLEQRLAKLEQLLKVDSLVSQH